MSKSEELMEKREKAMTEMLACLGVIAKGEFTGDVPARMAQLCIGEVHKLVVGQELPNTLSARGPYAAAGKAATALIEIRTHADAAQRCSPSDVQASTHIHAIHAIVNRVLGTRKVN